MVQERTTEPATARDPQGAFAELGRIMLGSQPLEAVLERVAELAAETIPHAEETSVTLIGDVGADTVAFSGPRALKLDERQYETGYGPCMDAATTGGLVQILDTSSSESYPDFARLARANGISHTLSVGLPVPNRTIGALNIYGSNGGPFDEDAVRLAQTFAGYAGVALANAALYASTAALAAQLQQAMESRAVIDQAKGILMSRHGCTPDEAFRMLSQASQRSNRKLRDIATAMVDGTWKEDL